MQHHYVLIPMIKKEQPRIVFAAYGQGVPGITAATEGGAEIVDERRGVLFTPGDPEGLANAISFEVSNRNLAKQ